MVYDYLEENLPSDWLLTVEHVESSSFGVGQHRPRVYLRGINTEVFSMAPLDPLPLPAHLGLRWTLNLDLPPGDQTEINTKHRMNLFKYKHIFFDALTDPSTLGTFACCDLSRDPTKKFGPVARCDDLAPCLTCTNEHLWVFALGELANTTDRDTVHLRKLSCDRPLHPCERALLQGFCPSELELDLCDATRVFGKSMTVSILGHNFAQVLLKFSDLYVG